MRPAEDYAALITRNVRAARAALRLSQRDLAARMRELGYATWYPQTVSNTESGKRSLRPAEALGLSVALETSLASIVFAPGDGYAALLPCGLVVMLPAARTSGQPAGIWDGNQLSGFPGSP